ncbi:MAG: hypothetical protein ACLR4Z_11045 [Butyricicoccaceae bacterium]
MRESEHTSGKSAASASTELHARPCRDSARRRAAPAVSSTGRRTGRRCGVDATVSPPGR